MESKELMIGDKILNSNGEIVTIYGITQEGYTYENREGDMCYGMCKISKPIPLTAEILEKNGWILNEDTYIKGVIGIWLDDEDETLWLVGTRVRDNMYHSFCDIRYVHQLQNLFRVADESILGKMEIKD